MSMVPARHLGALAISILLSFQAVAMQARADSAVPFYGYWDNWHVIRGERDAFMDHINIAVELARYAGGHAPAKGLDVVTRLEPQPLSPDWTQQQWQDHFESQKEDLRSAGEATRFILLMDEPYLRGYTVQQLEMIIDTARAVVDEPDKGISYKFGYTMTRGNLMFSSLAMPQNADYLGINHYPFVLTGSGNPFLSSNTQREFDIHTQDLLSIMRNRKAPETQIFLTGQGFYREDLSDYQVPPAESPLWYADVVRNNSDVAGLLWFEWNDRGNRIGSNSMPDLVENQKLAYQLILSGPDPDPAHSGPYVVNRSRDEVYFEGGGFESSMTGQAPREGDPHIGWWTTITNDITVVDADDAGFEAFTGEQFLRLQDSAAGRPQLSSEAVNRGSAGDELEIGLALRVEEGILRIRVRNEDGNSFLDPLFHADGTIEGRYGGAANPPPPGFDAYERFVLTQTLNVGEWNTVIMRYTLGEMDAYMSVNGGAFESMGAPDPGNQFRFINFRSEGNVAMVAYIDAIPEPASVVLLAMGAMLLVRRRR